MVFTEVFPLTTGIADDARIPSSEGIIIERRRALFVEGNAEENEINLYCQVIRKLQVIQYIVEI